MRDSGNKNDLTSRLDHTVPPLSRWPRWSAKLIQFAAAKRPAPARCGSVSVPFLHPLAKLIEKVYPTHITVTMVSKTRAAAA